MAIATSRKDESENKNEAGDENDTDIITVGRLVEVASRTWPGINKPGGVARVVEIHFDTSSNDENNDTDKEQRRNPTHVNVRYIVGSSREKRVPVEYVTLAPQYETCKVATKDSSISATIPSSGDTSGNYIASSLRDRSLLLGRCRRCGSLRTDCGSCDWAFEEEAALSSNTTRNRIATKSKKSSSSTKVKENKNVQSFQDSSLLDDESSSTSYDEDDDDDDMARLRKLVRRSQKRRRRRNRSKNDETPSHPHFHSRNGAIDLNDKSVKPQLLLQKYRQSKSRTRWRRRYPAVIDDSSSSSASSGSEIDESHHRRKEAIGNSAFQSNRRKLVAKRSVLESLPTNRVDGPSNKNQSKTIPSVLQSQQQPPPKPLKSGPLHFSSSSDLDSDVSSLSKNDRSTRKSPSSSKRTQRKQTPSSIHLNTVNNSERTINEATLNATSYDQQLLELEARARFQMKQQQSNLTNASAGVGNDDLDLDFIQPEGQEAVENLPGDIVDLTRSIPYGDLGSFYDSMATKIEDEVIPDLKLKMAGLHHKLRILQNKQVADNVGMGDEPDTIDTSATARQLLEEYNRLWEEVRSSVIRNGIDQCRASLRRLMDDRLYKKYRKQLTVKQRKGCRGSGIMDSRNLRMDAMDNSVEDFVRKLKEAVIICEAQCTEYNSIDSGSDSNGDSASSNIYSDGTSSDEEYNMNSFPLTGKENNTQVGHELAPFDPHEHASYVRKKGSNRKITLPKKSSRSTNSRRKRRRKISDLKTTRMKEQATMKNSLNSAFRVDSNDIEKEESADESMTNLGSDEDLRNQSMNKSMKIDFKKKEMVSARSKRKRKHRSEVPQLGFSKPRDSVKSISERMQAFLNANIDNEIRICSEDEVNEVELVERGSAANSRGQRQRQLSLFEANVIRQDDLPSVTQAGREQQGQAKLQRDRQLTSYDTNSLFAQLSSRARLSKEFAETLIRGDSRKVDTDWERLLSEMETSLSSHPQSMNFLLERAYNTFMKHGCRTIQDMIASNEAELSLHIRTLSCCVRSLAFVTSDGIPIIFRKEKQGYLLDFLILQMVDALYSSILPSAWALDTKYCDRVIHKLIPLRDALSSRIPLVEAVSRCIIKSLGCQEWRKSQSKSFAFISSLDPKCWEDFLRTGKQFNYPQVTRIQKLGRVWPSVEIDALWRILAFVGTAPSIPTDKSVFRLQIISKLFSSGVLTAEKVSEEDRLPPSRDHLFACQQEIKYFSSLLRQGALDSLPKTDSMLVKLIQRSLQLQIDSFEGDHEARASCFPNSQDDVVARKTSPIFWEMSHPLFSNSNEVNYRYTKLTDFPFDRTCDNHKTYKMLLYPTSNVLLSCMSLVINWVNRVSSKKIRHNRLINSMKALQDELRDKSKSTERHIKKVEVTFEDAFAMKTPLEVGIGSERASIFKLEAASYLQIVLSICMPSDADPDVLHSVWQNISDEQMKTRQCGIVELRKTIEKYKGDAYLLFATAKIMAILLHIQMNSSPWHLSLGPSITRLSTERLQTKVESFSFPLSCIFACLDCLCDIAEVGPQIFSQFYQIIILIFRNLTAIVVKGESALASNHLKSKCILNFNPVLIKCMRVHLVSSKGLHESFHLRLCLSLIRAIHTFVATCCQYAEVPSCSTEEISVDRSQTTANVDNGEDMWGDIDDSDLAALDLGGMPEGKNDVHKEEYFWELMSDALEQSKPSKRFAINQNDYSDVSRSSFRLSSMGKHLVAEEVNKICECLSTTLASMEAQEGCSFQLKSLVSKWSKPSYKDDEDSQYNSKIARKLTSETCLLAKKYPMCRNFVFEHANDMLSNFLKALMDPGRLEKLPSCNLERIGEKSGRVGTKQAILMLDLFNDESFQEINDQDKGSSLRKLQNKRRRSAIEVWNFCRNLGTAFVENNSNHTASITSIGNSLLNLDCDLIQKFEHKDDIISLENETFKAFWLLRNIVSYSATKYATFETFEKISSWSLLLLANHILNIVQSLKYNDQTSSDKEYKRATLTELLTSYIELFISLASWVLQEGAKNRSKTWVFFQSYLRDRLFSPILRSQPIDTTIALQELVVAARFVNAGPYDEGIPLPSINCVGLIGCSKYLGGCFLTSILRRSKQLLVATALNPQNLGLQNAIFEAVVGSSNDLEKAAPWIVGTTFPLSKNRLIRNRFEWRYDSPVQKQVDEYLEFVEENLLLKRKDNDDWWNSMASTKKLFLKNLVIPRLNSSSLGMDKKGRIVRLLNYILEFDAPRHSSVSDKKLLERTMDIHIARDIIKALRSNLHNCLMQFSVDNTIAHAIFSCSMHLANSCLLLEGQEQNLVGWSRKKILGVKGKTMLDLSNSEVLGSYVHIYFQWLRTFGEIVLNQNGDHLGSLESIASMRRHWRDTNCCRFSGMDEESLDLECSKSFEIWDRLLIDFEDLALPSKKKNKSNIVNIYVKSSATRKQEISDDESLLFQTWTPSIAVKKSLKETLAVILTTS